MQRGIKPFVIRPLKKVGQRFPVGEAQIADHLAAIRAQLPTTEVILIGTQAGKSSIVRGMTGQPAAMIGQGFKPHPQHAAISVPGGRAALADLFRHRGIGGR